MQEVHHKTKYIHISHIVKLQVVPSKEKSQHVVYLRVLFHFPNLYLDHLKTKLGMGNIFQFNT